MGAEEEESEAAVAAAVRKEEEEGKGEQAEEEDKWDDRRQSQSGSLIATIADKLIKGDVESQIEAAKDIRRVVRSSCSSSSPSSSSLRTRSRFAAAGVIPPLVLMLPSSNLDAVHASLLALLNLAVRDERNKVRIATSGAVPPLVELLKLQNNSLRELATAAILTLSTAAPNKPTIAASGAAPLLVQILSSGSVQGKVDAVTALYNLSTCSENSTEILDARAVLPLINLLKECKKYSKFAEKTTALLEILSNCEEGRLAISNSDGGILTLVETIEDGSLVSTEHAVGVLLTLCRSCRGKYRELILREGAIPGLLRLTAEGTPQAQERARMLLDLLRDSPKEKKLASLVMEKIAFDIAAQVDGAEKLLKLPRGYCRRWFIEVWRLLQDMVHRNIER